MKQKKFLITDLMLPDSKLNTNHLSYSTYTPLIMKVINLDYLVDI